MSGGKFYARSDGNGGYVISKGAVAIIGMAISILSIAVGIALWSATVKADVEHLKEQQSLTSQIVQQDSKDIEVLKSQITDIRDDVSEIKSDVKALVRASQ